MNIRYRKLIFSLVAFAYREIKSGRKENKNTIKILFVLSFIVYIFFFIRFGCQFSSSKTYLLAYIAGLKLVIILYFLR